MAVRSFFMINRSDREFLTERVRSAIMRWQQEWCADDTQAVEAACHESDPSGFPSNVEWHRGTWDRDMAVSVALADSEALMPALIGPLHEAKQESAAATELHETALRALMTALFNESGTSVGNRPARWDTAAPGSEIWDGNSGFVVLRWRRQNTDVFIVLHPSLTGAYLRKNSMSAARARGDLLPVRNALMSEKVVVEVCAGEAQLMLPELATLTVGDVIALDRRLDEPAVVTLQGGGFCAGYLGLRGDRKAIQLTSLHHGNEA